MIQWEYKFCSIDLNNADDEILYELNYLGRDGWEIISSTHSPEIEDVTYLFKRQLQPKITLMVGNDDPKPPTPEDMKPSFERHLGPIARFFSRGG